MVGLFLKRVTLTGFKSFANKTVIDLERGITGVVGPNGSGKSNLADAIRWALGEQAKSRLRLAERDEVVFAGTPKRARASYAEVVLLFDNESGAFPLDLTEVEISRRMYRDGETDYRLAGRIVRLSDIQTLLAQAGVGAGSYAVIGQGMIDSILMSSPSERKLLFEEAAGIRGTEMGREAAMRKLTATETNLTRLRDIAAELAPRLGSLGAAVTATDEHEALFAKITELRTAVSSAEIAQWTEAEATTEFEQFQLASQAHRLRHKRTQLIQEQVQGRRAEEAAVEQRRNLQNHLAALEQDRDAAAASLAAAVAATAIAEQAVKAAEELESRLRYANSQIETASEYLNDLHSELSSQTEAAALAAKAVDKAAREVAEAQASLVAIREGTGDGARDQYLDHALQILKTLAIGLGTPTYTENQIRLLVHKAGRLLSHATRNGAAELLAELKASQKHLEAAMTKRETAVEHQTNISITGRSLEIDLKHQEAEVERLNLASAELVASLLEVQSAGGDIASHKVAEHAAQARVDASAANLEAERTRLADLSNGFGVINAQSELSAAITRVQISLETLNARQIALRLESSIAEANRAAAIQRAKKWGVSYIQAPLPTTQLPSLVDQLARTETLFEAKKQIYEQQIGEYKGVTERQAELEAQIADLEAAEADLRSLVSELDTLIRARFKENFQALSEQFSLYFGRLFEGGTATLQLSEGEDSSYGITIKASPAGKRLASIAALSGGERALAGVALVAAIMKVNPSPFVVLDEIDAALDESNSGRLAKILTELQQYSQLIVITHNRQTMKVARVLFGVTLTDQHISSLISMRLEQATQLAAR
jgi:chromosome segregation ATPase